MQFETKRRKLEFESLRRLKKDVANKKEEVKRRFADQKKILEIEERNLIQKLEQIYTTAVAELNERNVQIKNLNQCRDRLEDCRNNELKATYNESIVPLNEKLYELKDDCILAPSVRLEWNENAVENFCSFNITSPPYSERVYPVWTAVEKGNNEKEMIEPFSVLALANGEKLVSDRKKNIIQIYNEEGGYKSCIQHPNLNRPLYMCTFKNALYVTCGVESGKVLKFENEVGQWVYADMQKVGHPITGLNIDEQGFLYIFLQKSLKVFALEADSLAKVAEFNLKTEHFVQGRTRIMDAKLYNSEWYILFINSEYSMQCFHKNGQLKRTVISSDLLKGSLHFCMDSDGNIIATENWTGHVKVFTNEGDFISKIGSHGDFASPSGVDLDKSGRIFICDLKTCDMISCY